MKKKFTKQLTALFMVGMLALTMTACSSKNDSDTKENPDTKEETAATKSTDTAASETEVNGGYTINFMLAQSSFKEDAHNAIKEKMKEMYNIDVEYEVVPDAQFTNLSQVRLSTGEAPDIIHVNIPDAYSTYDAANTLLPLQNQPWEERLSMDASPLLAEDGNLYGMPITGFSGVMGVIYNKTVFADLGLEVPTTYDEFLNVMETIKNESDVTPLYLSFKDTWTTQIAPMIYFANALDEKSDEIYAKLAANEITFADIPEYEQALVDFQDLFTHDYINEDYIVGTYDSSKEAVANGSAAMIIQGEYVVNDISTNWPDSDIGMFPLPYNDVEKVMTAKYVYALSIPSSSKNVDNALDFINKFSQPEFLEIYLSANAVNSPYSDVASENVNPILQDMYDRYLNTGEFVVQVGDVISKFGSLNDDVLFPAYAQVALADDIKTIISQIVTGMNEYGASLGVEGF